MEQKQLLKQMLEFNQAAFNNTFKSIEMIQDQFERAARSMLDQATWLPAEGRKAIDTYVEGVKSGREKYKQYLDESFNQVQKYFQ